jgi:DNA-binding CsgD family transcriptional regulator
MREETAFEVDRGNRIRSWPESASSLFGRDERAAIGKSWVDLLGARDGSGNRLCSRSCGLHAMGRAGEPIGVFELLATLPAGETVRVFGRAESCGPGSRSGLRFTFWRERRRGSLERRGLMASNPVEEHSPLTARETEVLRLLSRGHRIDEVAERLGVASATVRNHAQRVLPKLGASNRAEAVSIAIRLGLI